MNLLTRFQDRVRSQPQKLALITEKNRLNYEELLQIVQILAQELTTRGVKRGQVLVVATERPEIVIGTSFLASLFGLTLVYSTPEIADTQGLAYDAVLDVNDREVKEGCLFIKVESDWFMIMGTLPRPDYSTATGGGAFVFQTSGSTGWPKLVIANADDRMWEIDNNPIYAGGNRRIQRFLSTLSVSTGMALTVCQETLLEGGSIVVVADEKEHLLQYIDLYRVDTMMITPAMAERILSVPNAEQYLTSLKDVMFTGAYSANRLQRDFAALSGATLRFGYGAVEIGPICRASLKSGEVPREGYVGEFIRKDLEIALLDVEGNVLSSASEGLLAFRPKSGRFLRRYVSPLDSETKSGLTGDWFVPGDFARIEGNHVYFLGRAKNIVNLGGNKVALERVEAQLKLGFPKESLAAVAIRDADGHEALAIVREGDEAPAVGAVNIVLGEMTPKVSASVTASIKRFPLTPSGKIDRQAMVSLLNPRH